MTSIINDMTTDQLRMRIHLNSIRGIVSSKALRDELIKRDAAMVENKFVPDECVVAAVNELLDTVMDRHSNGDETFIECKVCGEWEDHAVDCFVPAVEKWQRA
jgi:hypothetical protein